MATTVIMPRQGQSVESCILTEWYKDVGDEVSVGDTLFAYETDKAAFEEEAREEGILLARYFEEGDEVPVLVNVAVIGKPGESFEESGPEEAESKPVSGAVNRDDLSSDLKHNEINAEGIARLGGSFDSDKQKRISPRARRIAKEKRIVVDNLTGSGPGGRVIERDILMEIEKGKRLTPLAKRKLDEGGLSVPSSGALPYGKIKASELVEGEALAYIDEPLSNVRRIIGEAMHRSLQNSAQLTHHLGANASALLALRKLVKKRLEEGYAYNITLNDMVCYAAIKALEVFPELNAHFLGDHIRHFSSVSLGLAIDTDRGLLVPALQNADLKSLPELSQALKALANNCKTGSISPDLLSPTAATFTISNLGNYGVEMFTPLINLPQIAILGVNTVTQRPTVLNDGTFAFQPFIGLSLTYDHRAIDGGPATRFLSEIKKQIEALNEALL